MRERSWVWLRKKINALLSRPPRVHFDGTFLPTTRIGWQLNPPKPPE